MAHCLTVVVGHRQRELISDCQVAPAVDTLRPQQSPPAYRKFKAIWDTGATQTVISERLVNEFQMKSTGIIPVRNAHAAHLCESHVVNIMLPKGIFFPDWRVTQQNLDAGFDVLIGMDIIGSGDFAVTNKNGETMFSFRRPSIESIDFCKSMAEEG